MPSDESILGSGLLPQDTFYERALQGLHRRDQSEPASLMVQAQQVLESHFGKTEASITTAYAWGAIGLISEHTYYFDGFAVVKSLPFATGVALRPSKKGQSFAVWGNAGTIIPLSNNEGHTIDSCWPQVIKAIIEEWEGTHGATLGIEVALISDIPPCCEDGYLAALAIALIRVFGIAFGQNLADEEVISRSQRAIALHLGRPYGIALPLAVYHAQPGHLIFLDTADGKYITLPEPEPERMTWVLLKSNAQVAVPTLLYQTRQDQAAQILTLLKKRKFPTLNSIGDLEHRDLDLALSQLSPNLKPILRHLVTENRRVVRLVQALRQSDWQMVGAMMVMSQASLQQNWGPATPEVEFMMGTGKGGEGIYGARNGGREFSSCMLFVGQPLALMPFLDRLKSTYQARFGAKPEIVLV